MFGLIIRRLSSAVLVLWLVGTIAFGLLNLLPGNGALASLPLNSVQNRALYNQFLHNLGLDKPLWTRYWQWLTHTLTGNWGMSLSSHQAVLGLVLGHVGPTAELSILSLLLSVLVAIPIAILSAVRPSKRWDFFWTSTTLAGVAVPNFLIGISLILLLSVASHILPAGGYVSFFSDPVANLKLMIMPSVTLGAAMAAITMRQARASLASTLREDYIRTAESKGVGEASIVIKHALRNALIPVVTTIGLNLGRLFGGAIVVEQIYSIPGVGQLVVDSVFARDLPVVQGVVMFMAAAVVFSTLLTDLAYIVIDPRLRVEV